MSFGQEFNKRYQNDSVKTIYIQAKVYFFLPDYFTFNSSNLGTQTITVHY